jgi:alpha-galactosidase
MRPRSTLNLKLVAIGLLGGLLTATAAEPAFWSWAKTPPMGWNSWDGFATTVTEAQTRAQADFMAQKLHQHGWEYIVVDIQWYEPNATGFDYRRGAKLEMDALGRLMPATNKFPSAMDGKGFKPLADYVHSLGLKFGLHLMRGIPRQAVAQKTPIQGTSYTAADIANSNNTCRWNGDMYGVETTRPGAQEYYNSVFDQFAAWGLDFVKVDDLSRPYHQTEIEAIRKAIDQTGRKMVFSTSPGATPLSDGEHINLHANMWRISDDFWDNWKLLFEQFGRVRGWTPYRGPGHFPDADMLPIGILQMGKTKTHFSRDEQFTLMSLWSIARSPLMIGADLTKLDDFTLSLLTNDEVLAVNQSSSNNHELFHRDDFYGWVADVPGSADKYLALFNTRPKPEASMQAPEAASVSAAVTVKLAELGFTNARNIRNLWTHQDLGSITNEFAPVINVHGAGVYRVSPKR